jgi:alpha-D-ribose 1-methylphosphonate 5-phosphate C-P lyase
MVRKLEDGQYLLDRDPAVEPANRIRPIDAETQKRHADNKQAAFRKP